MTASHASHIHPATSAARAACRKEQEARGIAAWELLEALSARFQPRPGYWVDYAAHHFAATDAVADWDKALAVINYFYPTGDAKVDDRRRADGYVVTTSLTTIVSTIFHSAS